MLKQKYGSRQETEGHMASNIYIEMKRGIDVHAVGLMEMNRYNYTSLMKMRQKGFSIFS